MKKVKEFTIDYKMWGMKHLLRDDQKMCCLGFFGKACGAGYDEMYGIGTPYESKRSLFPNWCVNIKSVGNTASAVNRLMEINDDETMKPSLKMAGITKIFKNKGVSVKWKNVPTNTMKAFKKLMKK